MKTPYNTLKVSILILLFLGFGQISAQNHGAIRGQVMTSDGQYAPSVAVAIKHTSKGTHTNQQGEFEIRNVAPGTYTLLISFEGLQAREVSVQVFSGETTRLEDIILSEDAQQLSEITISASKTNPFQKRQSEYVSKLPLENLENAQVY